MWTLVVWLLLGLAVTALAAGHARLSAPASHGAHAAGAAPAAPSAPALQAPGADDDTRAPEAAGAAEEEVEETVAV